MKQLYARFYLLFIIFLLTGFNAFAQTEFTIQDVKHACNGQNNGALSVVVTAGEPTFTISVIGPSNKVESNAVLDQVYTFSDLKPGSYIIVVQNVNGDPVSKFENIQAVSGVTIDSSVITNNSCTGSADGSISLSVSGGTGEYLFSLDGGATFVSNPITGLSGGTYTVTVSDANTLCSASATYTVEDELTLSTSSVTLCQSDDPYDLTAATSTNVVGGTYTFSGTGVSGNTFDPEGLVADTYSIGVVYEVNGCVANGTIEVQVLEKPAAPTTSTPAAICVGGDVSPISITTSNAAYTIRIFRDAALTDEVTGASASFDPDNDTPWYDKNTAGTYTYYIVQSNQGCNSDATAIPVVVNALPTATFATNSIEVCDGEDGTLTVNFTGQQPFDFTYNDGSQDITVTGIASTSHTIDVLNVTADLVYTIKAVSDANTCKQEGLNITGEVTKLDKPEVTLTLSQTEACQEAGGAFVLSGGMPEGGTYYVDGVEATQIALDEEITEDKIYTIIYRYTDAKGCTNESSPQSFTVHPLPQITFSMEKTSFCIEDNSVNLDALPSGGTFSGNGVSGKTFHAKNAGVGTHDITYTYTDGNNCTNSSTVTVEVKPMLDAEVSIQASATTVCAGGEITFSIATSANLGTDPTYQWLVNGSPVAGETAATFISTSIVDGDDVQLSLTQGTLECGTGNTVLSNIIENIKVNPLPAATWTSADQTICAGVSNVELGVNVSSGTAPFTLTYTAGTETLSATLPATGDNTITVSPSQTTTYTLVSISDANGCSQSLSGEVIITVAPTNELTVDISPLAADVCPGQPVSFTATVSNAGTDAQYQWYVNGAPVSNDPSSYILENPVLSTAYEVYLEVRQGTVACPDSEPVVASAIARVTVTEANAAFSGPDAVCVLNSATYTPEVSGGSFSSVPAGYIDASSGVFSTTLAGEYTIIYSITQNGCTESTSKVVTVAPATDPGVTLSAPVTEVCNGGSLTFTATANNAGTNPVYQWLRNGTVVEGETSSTYTATNISGTSLLVEVRVSKDPATTDCISNTVASDSETITVNERPTVTLAGEATICSGESTDLQFSFTGIAPYTLVYSDGTTNYTVENITASTHTVGVSPATTTSYSVVSLTDAKSCTAASLPEAVTVTVTSAPATAPVVTATEDGCTSFTLSWDAVTGAADYVVQVDTDETFSAPLTADLTITGTSQQISGLERGVVYYYRVYARNSCGETTVSGTGNITLEQITAPLAEQPAAANISCDSFLASWTAVSGATAYTVELSTSNSFTSILQSQVIAAPATSYTFTGLTANTQYYYRLSATSACGTSAYSNVVEVNTTTEEVATVALRLEESLTCATTTAVLIADATNAGEGAIYSWFVGAETAARQATTSNRFELTAAELPATVRVELTSTLACVNTDEVVSASIDLAFPAVEAPVLTAGAESLCFGQAIEASASGENLEWVVSLNGTSVHTQSGANLSFTPTVAGEYTVAVTQQPTGCQESEAASYVVTVTDQITVTASLAPSEPMTCNTTSVTLLTTTNAGEGATYAWSRNGELIAGESGSSLTLSSFADGEEISVTVTSALSCATGPATASYTLNKTTATAPVVDPAALSVCAGEAIVLNAEGTNISWYIKLDGVLLETRTGNQLNYTPAQNGVTYTIEATQQADGCPESPATTVLAEVKATVAAPVLEANLVNLCQGTGATVTASGTGVVWYSDAALTTVASNTENLLLPGDLAAGDYTYYAVANADGCSSAATELSVKVTAAPEVNLGSDIERCAPASVELNSGYSTDAYEIIWRKADSSIIAENVASITVDATDTYTVTVTDRVTRCSGSDAIKVSIETEFVPAVTIELAQEFTCNSTEIVLEAVYTGGGDNPTFIWMKNFVPIEGATGSILSLNVSEFVNGDDIIVEMTSSLECAEPKKTEYLYDIVFPTAEQPELSSYDETTCPDSSMPTFSSLDGVELNWYKGVPGGDPIHVGVEFTPALADLQEGPNAFYATYRSSICENPHVEFNVTLKAAGECGTPCTATPTVTLRMLPGSEICADITSVKLEADTAQVGQNPAYAWFYNGIQFSTEASPVFTLPADAASGDLFRVEIIITDPNFICNGVNMVSDEETLTISEQVQATVAITPIDPVCAQSTTPVTLTATGTYIDYSYAGLTTTYLWDIDGTLLTTTTNTVEVVPSQLTAGLVKLTVQLPAELACVLAPEETSYQIQFAAEEQLAVNLSSSAPNGTCPGTAITFTASSPEAGTNPIYTFFLVEGGVETEVQSGISTGFVLADPQNGQQVKVSVQVTDPTVSCITKTATSAPVDVLVLTSEECVGGSIACGPFTVEVTELVRPSCAEDNGKLVLYITSTSVTTPFRLTYKLGDDRIVEQQVVAPHTLTVDRISAMEELVVTLNETCIFKYVLEEAPRLSATLTKSADGDIKCFGENTGKAVLSVTGGNAPYEYLLEGSTTWQVMNGNTIELKTLSAGINNVLVRQNENDICPATASVEILNLGTEVLISYEAKPANCNDESGAITLTKVEGGYGNTYRVKINNGVEQTFINGETTSLEFTGLPRGRHTLYITDEQGCQTAKTVLVPSPGLIALTPEVYDPLNNSTDEMQYSGVVPYNCEVPHLLNGIRLVIDKELTDFAEVGYDFVATYKRLDVENAEENRVEFQDEHIIYGLTKGRYQVIISAKNDKGCPENRIFEIKGDEAPSSISFTAEAAVSCDNVEKWIRISELKGDAEQPFTIIVRDLNRNEVARRTLTRAEYLDYIYWDVVVPATGSYEVKVEQDQTSCENNESSAWSEPIRVSEILKLNAEVTGTTVSLPERATGTLSFNITNGSGTAPYTSSLVWVARIEGQEDWVYTSYDDLITLNGTTGKYDFTYTNLPPGIYELTIMDAKGCSVVITEVAEGVPLMVDYDKNLFIPNVITPNGDNVNEVFYIRNMPAGTELTITNRWGKVVYESADYQNDWDGGSLNEGIYYYSIKILNSETGIIKGWLQIKRGALPN